MDTQNTSTTVYAGIGTDLRKKISQLQKDQNKMDPRLVDVHNIYFVDPDIPNDIEQHNVERIYIEDFIRKSILKDYTIFNNGTLESDRMIEHIDIEQLYLITMPLMLNLVKYCNTKLSITYPSIDMVTSKLHSIRDRNDSEFSLFEHELCNIEAIAFGEHKTLLNKSRIQSMIYSHGLNFDIKFDQVQMNNKLFYENVKVSNLDNYVEFVPTNTDSVALTKVEPAVNIKDFVFEFSNKLEYAFSRNLINPDTYVKQYVPENYYIQYIDIEKLHKCCKAGMSDGTFNYVYDQKYVENVFTREGYFETVNHPGIELLNKIDPFYGWYAFHKIM